MPSGSMPSDLRKENQKSVLKIFHDNKVLTAAEVSERTGISRLTVKKCIEYYVSNGILQSCGKGMSSKVGGKRPEQYSLNDQERLVCILIHHNEIIVNVMDLYYNQINSWKSGDFVPKNMDAMWQKIQCAVEELLDEEQISHVIAACMVAPLGHVNGCLTVATPFPNWPVSDFGRSLTEPVQKLFPRAKYVDIFSDGRCAGAALLKQQEELRECKAMLTIYTSHGIGGGLFRHGKAIYGTNNMIGAWGHIIVDPADLEPCSCGSHGCLERIVCRKRMRERLIQQKELYEKSCLAETPIEQVTYEQIFQGSAKGDRLCRRESVYCAGIYAVAIRSMILSIEPDYLFFQGDFGKADKAFQQELLNRLSEFKYIGNHYSMRIGYDAADLVEQERIGAAYLMIQEYMENTERFCE